MKTLPYALLLIFGSASAQTPGNNAEAIRKDLATPQSSIEVGIGHLLDDARRFGAFRGMNAQGSYGLVNIDLIQRDDDTGSWLKLKGKELGLDTRDIRFDHERQGDWSYFLEAGQQTRDEPWIANTGLSGIGTPFETISSTAPKHKLDLKIQRDTLGLGVRKFMVGGFDVRLSFKQEEKRGDRMYGVGTVNNQDFLTEPLDRTTRQWDLLVGYANKKFQLSGGYSGSSFENHNPALNLATTGTPAVPFPLLAMPPSNEAHQLHLAGGYNFSQTVRSSFKFSRQLALQDSRFAAPTVKPALGGRMVTTLGYADVALRPLARVDLHASLRYQDRDDQTDIARYISSTNVPTATNAFAIAGVSGFNVPRALKQIKGALEAGLQLDDGYRLIGTLEQEQSQRTVPFQYRRVGYREKTDETLGRIELKQLLSETLNGSLAYLHADRGGSEYANDTYALVASSPTNQINPLIWADRSRDKLRFTADWVPEENWSMQFIGDVSSDKYAGRNLGPRKGSAFFSSLDVSYTLANNWKLGVWLAQEFTRAEQTTHTDYSVAAPNQAILWDADIRNRNTGWGISLKGKPRQNLEVGAELSSSIDNMEYCMGRLGSGGIPGSTIAPGAASPVALPEYFYRQTTLKLNADYALDNRSGVRGQIIIDHRSTNDWSWAGFNYTDGTTVSQPDPQNTSFIGATYYYKFR